jgi:hypothetical protein
MYPSRSGIGFFSPRVGGSSAHRSPPSGQNLSAIALQLESIPYVGLIPYGAVSGSD